MAKRKKIKARQEGFFRNVALVLFFGVVKGTTDAKIELPTRDASKGSGMPKVQQWEQRVAPTSRSISFMMRFVQKLRTLGEELQERKKNKQHIPSRQKRLSLFLAICILFQTFGVVIAPLETYAAAHVYNYDRYTVVQTPNGSWNDTFTGNREVGYERRSFQGYKKEYRVGLVERYLFNVSTGTFSLNYNGDWIQVDSTYSSSAAKRTIEKYPYVSYIKERDKNTNVWNDIPLDPHTLYVITDTSYDQSEKYSSVSIRSWKAQPSGYNYTRGQYLATVQATDGTYPDNGRHSDGYFYTKKGVINSAPSVSISTSGTRYISLANNSITISGWAADQDGDTLTVTGNLGGVTKSMTMYPGSWSLTWSASELAEGTLSMNVSVHDGYGGTAVATYSGSLIADKTPPTAPSITGDRSGWYNGNKMITITHGSDSLSGVQKSQVQIGSGSWTDYTVPFAVSDRVTINARTVDQAGNISPISSLDAQIDKTAPSAPSISLSDSGFTTKNVTVTVTGGQDSYSGVLKSQYRIGGSGVWTDYIGPFQISTVGETPVYARTIDHAGNASAESTATVRIIRAKPVKPAIVLNPVDWTDQNVTATVVDPNNSDSGITCRPQYKLGDSGAWMDYNTPLTLQEENASIHARVIDITGNISDETVATVRIDRTAPTEPTIQQAANNNETGSVITITGGTDTQSGVSRTEYKVGDNGTWTSYTAPFTINPSSVAMVYARSVDRAGNRSNEAVKMVEPDTYQKLVAEAVEAVEKAEASQELDDVNTAVALIHKLRAGDQDKLLERMAAVQQAIDAQAVYMNKLAEATHAVEKAESSKLQADIELARALADSLDETDMQRLLDRLNQIKASDVQKPSKPANVKGLRPTPDTVILTWEASTDDVGVVGYDIFSNDQWIGSTHELTFEVTGLDSKQLYSFAVRAKDAAGNLSEFSNTITSGLSKNLKYNYDAHGRLLNVEKDGQVILQYEYDSNGNLIRIRK